MEVLLGTISFWGGLEEEEDLVEWREDWTRLSKEVDKGTLKCKIEWTDRGSVGSSSRKCKSWSISTGLTNGKKSDGGIKLVGW